MSRKRCGKRKNCSLRAISSFPTVFSKDFNCRHVKTRACLGKKTLECASIKRFSFSQMVYTFFMDRFDQDRPSKLHFNPLKNRKYHDFRKKKKKTTHTHTRKYCRIRRKCWYSVVLGSFKMSANDLVQKSAL